MLSPFVKEVWSAKWNDFNAEAQGLRFFADGCPGIMYYYSGDGLFLNGQLQGFSGCFLYGQTITPLEVSSGSALKVVVVILYPAAAHYLFGLQAKELRDKCTDLKTTIYSGDFRLWEQLEAVQSPDAIAAVLLAYLRHIVMRKQVEINPVVEYALTKLQETDLRLSMTDIHRNLYLTERSFERVFDKYVGISPRLYAKVYRFNQSLQQLNRHSFAKFSDLAFDQGYADQSHFIRQFKTFTGLTPGEYKDHLLSVPFYVTADPAAKFA